MKVRIGSKTYELPKKTLPIAEKIEDFSELAKRMEEGEFSIREYVEKQHAFLCDILGEGTTDELFGRDFETNADIDQMTFACKDIIKAYSEEMQQRNAQEMAQQVRSAIPKEVFDLARLMQFVKDNAAKNVMRNA